MSPASFENVRAKVSRAGIAYFLRVLRRGHFTAESGKHLLIYFFWQAVWNTVWKGRNPFVKLTRQEVQGKWNTKCESLLDAVITAVSSQQGAKIANESFYCDLKKSTGNQMHAKIRLVIIFCTAGILAHSATVAVAHVLAQLSCTALRRLHKWEVIFLVSGENTVLNRANV